jgi:hypothetical protein
MKSLKLFPGQRTKKCDFLIKDLESSSPIRMDELDQAMNKKLSVTISVSESDFQAVWKPVDNSNILILLRE